MNRKGIALGALLAGVISASAFATYNATAVGTVKFITQMGPGLQYAPETFVFQISNQPATTCSSGYSQFLVSPGSTASLLDAMTQTGLPHLPGMSTVSEALMLLERGYRDLKFFPAEACGGTAFLRAIQSPLPGARFCPTGGINAATVGSYLSLPNVGCVGGSWLTPSDVVAAQKWDRVRALAAATARLTSAS